jgi:hypothetical protein
LSLSVNFKCCGGKTKVRDENNKPFRDRDVLKVSILLVNGLSRMFPVCHRTMVAIHWRCCQIVLVPEALRYAGAVSSAVVQGGGYFLITRSLNLSVFEASGGHQWSATTVAYHRRNVHEFTGRLAACPHVLVG